MNRILAHYIHPVAFFILLSCTYSLISSVERIYRYRAHIACSIFVNVGISLCLGMLVNIGLAIPSSPWQLYLLELCCMHYCLMFIYFFSDQLLNDKLTFSIVAQPLFYITTILVVITAILGYFNHDYLQAVISNEPFIPHWKYSLFYIFYYGVQIYLGLLIAPLYWKRLRWGTEPTHFIRYTLAFMSLFLSTFSNLLAELDFLLTMFRGPGLHSLLKYTNSEIRILTIIIFLSSVSLPQSWLVLLVKPLKHLHTLQKKQQAVLLNYLHAKMIQIVPTVHLHYEALHDIRIPIEISDARQIIWSWTPLAKKISPRIEAQHLLSLLQQQVVITCPGIHQQPMMCHYNIIRYNLAVAKHLKKFEQRLCKTTVA